MTFDSKNLFKRLFELQFLSETNIRLVSDFASKWNLSPYDAIVETKVLSETKLADFLAEDAEFKRLRKMPKTDQSIKEFWSFEMAFKNQCVPIKLDRSIAKFALAEANAITIELLKKKWATSHELEFCIIEKARLLDFIASFYEEREQNLFFEKHLAAKEVKES